MPRNNWTERYFDENQDEHVEEDNDNLLIDFMNEISNVIFNDAGPTNFYMKKRLSTVSNAGLGRKAVERINKVYPITHNKDNFLRDIIAQLS